MLARAKSLKRSRVYLGAAGFSLVAALVLGAGADSPFARFFGPLPPLAVVAVVAVAGFAILRLLARAGWVGRFPRQRKLRVALRIAGLATLFSLPTMLADSAAPFPPNMNVPMPAALLFYPAIGLVVEVLFHLAPLALLFAIVRALGATANGTRLFWACAIPVAFLEPVFQTVSGAGAQAPLWQSGYVATQLLALNLVQLALLRRHGFAAAFGFRLVYYLWWHILWGTARLQLLF